MKKVVVVESPAKAKTINRYLGNDYVVLASYGHIRDLPSKNGSVEPDEDFKMVWEVDPDAKSKINEIAKALKGADALYLATDPDREGEAISWHVQQVLEEKNLLAGKTVQRIVFNEITKTAVQHAIANPRDVKSDLVDAYLARRALDYLVGFTLSPVLWRKLPGAKSAGRVQSVALRLIVEREQEIDAFITQEYWSITGMFATPKGQTFLAKLTHLDGKKLDKFALDCEEIAKKACEQLKSGQFHVASVDKKQVRRNPAAPFITSTLQQEASRKLGFGATRTMQIAQKLYEGVDIGGEVTGLITYMRTDGVTLAQEAIDSIRGHIKDAYGDAYLPGAARIYKSKSKNAQEAHEAIRPTSVLRRPQDVAAYLDEGQLKLYDLIWKRTVACQMENAIFDQVGIDVVSENKKDILRATGSTLVFDGFLRLYQEGVDDSDENDDDKLLPAMNMDDPLATKAVTPNQHFTQPPPRYSEASLIKKLEELGIGRPSTYTSIIHTLQGRSYVKQEKRHFIPEERGRIVTSFLSNYFHKYIEYDFTANLEDQLDEISDGKLAWKKVLTDFWKPFIANIDSTKTLTVGDVLERVEHDLSLHLFGSTDEAARVCPTCQKGRLGLRLGKFGSFLGCSDYPECKYTRPLDGQDEEAYAIEEPIPVGIDPESGVNITVRKGPYGHYLQWDLPANLPPPVQEFTKTGKPKKIKELKPKRVGLQADTDPKAVTLEFAMTLKALPKMLGPHPETGEPLSIGLGRFGPYIKNGDAFVSIPKAYDFLKVDMDQAVEIITKKANSPSRGRMKKKAPAKKAAAKKTTKTKAE